MKGIWIYRGRERERFCHHKFVFHRGIFEVNYVPMRRRMYVLCSPRKKWIKRQSGNANSLKILGRVLLLTDEGEEWLHKGTRGAHTCTQLTYSPLWRKIIQLQQSVGGGGSRFTCCCLSLHTLTVTAKLTRCRRRLLVPPSCILLASPHCLYQQCDVRGNLNRQTMKKRKKTAVQPTDAEVFEYGKEFITDTAHRINARKLFVSILYIAFKCIVFYLCND